MRLHRHMLVAVLLGATGMALPAGADAVETSPSISAYNEPFYGRHYWTPSTATVGAGGVVKFVNPYNETSHGLKFTGGSAGVAPSCTGIPPKAETLEGAPEWNGECTFDKPGTYTFICTVHAEMTGTIAVTGTPKAKTTAASGANQTEGTLNGTVEPEGVATEYHFEYGIASVSEHTSPTINLGAGDFAGHLVAVRPTGLSPGEEYHFQLVVTYGAGKTTVFGGEKTFTTPAPVAPMVHTSEATGEGQHEATLNGTVDPGGGSATEYFFEYGATASYGKQTILVTGLPADNANHQVSATVSELRAATVYHFRLVAKNAVGGPVGGADATFTTATPPQPAETSPSVTTTTAGTPPPAPPPALDFTTTTTTTMPAPASLVAPLVANSLKLVSARHSTSVRGLIDVSPSGAGGKLEVALLASNVSLAAHRPSRVRIGRYLRSSVRAGMASFAVGLNARGRSALRRHERLVVTVRIVLTPVTGAPASMTRSVVLHGT